MKGSRSFTGATVLAAFIAAGCNGSDDTTGPQVADFSGEYTYEVTGAGGTCVELPRATGGGVEIVFQDAAWVTDCLMRDLCDGEFCRAGPVEGSVFTTETEGQFTDGTCDYRLIQSVTATRDTAGLLHRRIESRYEVLAGDCSAKGVPCDTWQTSVATPCESPCYDAYCLRVTTPAPTASVPGMPGD